MDKQQKARYDQLTDRELEILRLIADGLSNQQIADQLFLTLDTVKWYNKQSYQKLGVRKRTEAVKRARELGLFRSATLASANNLNFQGTVFIGRESELADIRARLIDPDCRLFTLIGPGGIGKTRLAIEAAQQQLKNFPDGVYFLPLASIESSAFIVTALADVLNLTQSSQLDPRIQIINYLREKTILLVMDNFEHLLDGAHLLSDIIAKSRQAKILVTSRERLHLQDEWLFDVQGLPYPVAEDLSDNPADYEAVQLFIHTAQRVQTNFSLEVSGANHIAHICQLVGGMPLAIELAASWVRVLSCADIANEIKQSLDILSTSLRDIPERHRSIQAVLEYSWRLLSEAEQVSFCKLTVFSGSFQREAAEFVATASLGTILGLLDKSFLKRFAQDRFTIHELLRQFGNVKLRAHNDIWMQTRLQHCHYFVRYIHQRMVESDVLQHLHEIDTELDNIQSAWRFAIDSKQLNEICSLVVDLWLYFQLRSWYQAGSDAIDLYHQALVCFESDANHPEREKTIAILCDSLGGLYALKGMYNKAMLFYNRAIQHTADNDRISYGRILRQIGDVWVMMNDHAKAHATYLQAEAVLESVTERNPLWRIEWTHMQTERMWLYYWANRLEDMLELDSQIREMIEEHSLIGHRVRYLNVLAMMSLRRDRYFNSKDAIDYSGQALALSIESGNLSEIAWSHFAHGFCHLWSDHLDEAEKHILISQKVTEENGDLTMLARSLTYLGVVYRKRNDLVRVREYVTYSLKVAEDANMPQYIGSALAQSAWLAWREGDTDAAESYARSAIGAWGGLGDEQTIFSFRWLALFPLLGLALQQEDIVEAMNCARDLLTPPQQRLPDKLTRLLEGAVIAMDENRLVRANDLLRNSIELAQAMGYL